MRFFPFNNIDAFPLVYRLQIGQRPQLSSELEKLRSPASISAGVKDNSATYSTDEMEMLSTMVRLFYSCTDPSPSKRPSAEEAFSALESELTRRACTTSTRDGQNKDHATTALEVPKIVFAQEVADEELVTPTEKSCAVCLRPAKSCVCNGCGLDSKEKNLSSSDSDSSRDT